MANNFHCLNHLDDNAEHKDCTLCNTKGDICSEQNKMVCPNTKKLLKLMGQTIIGATNIVFKNLPSYEKTAMLKKRATVHFKANIEEKKRALNQQLRDEATGKI